ncbi:MAG TPA: extracellular solute-binding protein [Firmicutes bacterium]|nr:extracellular solute-binding protein [Bacillota bacterium]
MVRRCGLVLVLVLLVSGLMASTAAAEKTKITMWTFSGGSGAYPKIHEGLLEELYKAIPEVELDIQYTADPDKYLVAYTAGVAPDIISMRTSNQAKFIDAGMMAVLDPKAFGCNSVKELESKLLPGAVETMKYRDGRIYFMATEISIFGLFYNKTLMEQAGVGKVPTTWEEMLLVGSKFLRLDAEGKATQTGIYIPRGWIWPTFTFPALMRGYKAEPLTADGQPQFSQPNAIKAVEIYPELFRKLSNNTNLDWKRGNTAFNWGANYMIADFKNSGLLFDWGAAPLPKFENGVPSTTSYALGHFVSSQSKNPELAWRVVAFYTGPETAERWYTEVALWHPWSGAWLERIFRLEPMHRPFLESLAYALPELSHPRISEINSLLGQAETRIFNGTQSVEMSLQQLDSEILAMLAK